MRNSKPALLNCLTGLFIEFSLYLEGQNTNTVGKYFFGNPLQFV